MNWLKQSTSVVWPMGPFLDKTDGVTLKTGLVSALDHVTTGIMLSKNGGTLAVRHATVTPSTYDARGLYKVTLDGTDTATLGSLRAIYEDFATCLPVWEDFMVVPQSVYSSLFGASADTYQAKVWLQDDDVAAADRYMVVWFLNGVPIFSGITLPTIQVIKVSDGTDLVASAAMTQIGTTGMYRYNETLNRIADGAGYMVVVTATIDSVVRTWVQPVGRDSAT